MKKRYKPIKFVSFLELSDDPDELLELLGQSESLTIHAQRELQLRQSEGKLIREKLKKVRRTTDELTISDHAVVRYMERVVGIDIESCKQEMLSKLPDKFTPTGEAEFITISKDGLQYVIRDNLIISVTPTSKEKNN